MTCFGKFLHTVIAGWDDCECVRAFEAICNHTSLLKNVNLILTAKSGKKKMMLGSNIMTKIKQCNTAINFN